MKISFEWDVRKNAENQRKHGVSFEEAQLAFLDPRRYTEKDLLHSANEERYHCYGKIGSGVMTVRFTVRGNKIRIFGAAYWRKGKKIYDQKNHL